MNRVQNIRINAWKYKAVECLEMQTGKDCPCNFFSTCL